MDNRNLVLRNKSVLMKTRSRRCNQGMKTLGIAKKRYYSEADVMRVRYKQVGDRMRERYRKSKGLRLDGRIHKRHRKRKR